MNEKRNYKQELKELWDENKVKIKVGVTCLCVGAFCGFIKGINTQSKIDCRIVRDMTKAASNNIDSETISF